jgi:hypothetical protein
VNFRSLSLVFLLVPPALGSLPSSAQGIPTPIESVLARVRDEGW